MDTTTVQIHRMSTQARATKNSVKGNPSCCYCNNIFANVDPSQTGYTHPNGQHVEICFKHIQRLVNQPGTYFKRLSSDQAQHFNLIGYLRGTRKRLIKKRFLDPRAQKTLEVLTEIFDIMGLFRYFEGPLDYLLRHGFKPLKDPAIKIPEIVEVRRTPQRGGKMRIMVAKTLAA